MEEADPDKARAGLNELELNCYSLGNMECGFVARGKNIDETAEKMIEHFKKAHSDKYGKMDASQKQALEQRAKELVH
ncbi:MAG: hypothetical protein FJY98_01705 [Candidatus Liptonbacteria bacterium]|nr:hypothetical protein [Candidatus Pacearchaeota archaeon]MBM3257024.1 hypothetical protein [Candidatus Liptonbacteria bacterium]